MKIKFLFLMLLISIAGFSQVFQETNGIVAVEAENFFKQENDEIRKWVVIGTNSSENNQPENSVQIKTASRGKYIALLPDTRITHEDELIPGVNFSNEPGKMAIVSYKVNFKNTGKYYVWVRAFSNGSEDNGIHVGLNGNWPESGQRMQWCDGKNQWFWDSKQRTEKNHCGEEKLIFLEITSPGEHIISFSMREDGFKFDKFIMSKAYVMPEGEGVEAKLEN